MAPRRHWTGTLAALVAPPPSSASPARPRARTWLQASSPARLELLRSAPGGGEEHDPRGGGACRRRQPTTAATAIVGLQVRLMTGHVMLRCDDLSQGSASGGPSVALVRGSSSGGGGGNADGADGGGGGSGGGSGGTLLWLLLASCPPAHPSAAAKPTCHLVFRFFDPADGADFARGLEAMARQRLGDGAAAASLAGPGPTAAAGALLSPGQQATLEAAIRRAVASKAPAEVILAAMEQDLAAAAARAAEEEEEEEEDGVAAGRPSAASSSSSSSPEQQLEALVAIVEAMWTDAERGLLQQEEGRRRQARPPKSAKN